MVNAFRTSEKERRRERERDREKEREILKEDRRVVMGNTSGIHGARRCSA